MNTPQIAAQVLFMELKEKLALTRGMRMASLQTDEKELTINKLGPMETIVIFDGVEYENAVNVRLQIEKLSFGAEKLEFFIAFCREILQEFPDLIAVHYQLALIQDSSSGVIEIAFFLPGEDSLPER